MRPSDQEMRIPVDLDPEAGAHQRDKGSDNDGKQGQIPGVDDMGTGQRGPLDGRPQPLGEEDGADNGEERRTGHLVPVCCEGVPQPAPVRQRLHPDHAEPHRQRC